MIAPKRIRFSLFILALVLLLATALAACTEQTDPGDTLPAATEAVTSATEEPTEKETEPMTTPVTGEEITGTVTDEITEGTIEETAEETAETSADETIETSIETPTEEITEETTEEITLPSEDPALNVFPEGGNNIEIGIFWEPPFQYTTPEQYDWIRDANVTFIEITNREGAINKEASNLQLKLAAERGINVAYSVGVDGKDLLRMSEQQIIDYMNELKKNPIITDIHVRDEPAEPWVYSAACRAIMKAGVNPRLNFLPFWATWVFENYQGHVEDTIIEAGKEYYGSLCYDQYPFPYNGGDPDMFYNLNMFREIGLKYDVPTAFYIQSIGEGGNFRRTNGGEIRYHTSAGLAYGLKSMTYFTWWTTGFCDPKDYAIISPYGEKTDIYDDVASINGQILKVGPVLARLDALEVHHTGGSETGITRCDPTAVPLYAKPKSRYGVIISLMEDRETGRDYIMLVNKNYKKEATYEFELTDAITHLYNLNSGEYAELDISTGKVELTFEPGGFILLAVGQHDNIVDQVWDTSANMAEGKAPAVDSSVHGGGYYAYCLTDGNRDNTVLTAIGYRCTKNTGWVEVDLGRVTSINRVDIYPTGTKFTRGQKFPVDFTIEISADRENWVKVAEHVGYTDCLNAIPSFTFETAEARYVRMNVTKGCATGGFEIAEIEIFNDDGTLPTPDNDAYYAHAGSEPAGTNVALEREVTASSNVIGWEPSGLTNGSAGSGSWTSAINRHPTADHGVEWVLIDLAYNYDIDKVVLYGRPGDDYFPYKFYIEVSEDGKTFTRVYDGECPEKREGQQPFECPLTNVKGRYVRIVGYSLRDQAGFGDGHLFSLCEVEVYNK